MEPSPERSSRRGCSRGRRRPDSRLRPGRVLRRDVRGARPPAAALPRSSSRASPALMPATLEERSRVAIVVLPHAGDHLHGLRRRRRAPSASSLRPRAADHPGRRVGADRARARAAHPRAQPLPRRLYHDQKILARRRRPGRARARRRGSSGREMIGVRRRRGGIYAHIARHRPRARRATASYLVLEDNLRTPSGVSLRAREPQVMKRVFPQLFEQLRACGRSSDYPRRAARDAARRSRRAAAADPTRRAAHARARTTRPTSSTRSSPSRWASSSSRGSDLVVDDDRVFMRTTQRPASAST